MKELGLDLDDVLLNFNDSLRCYHNKIYGTNYERNEIASYDLEKVWGCSREEAIRRVLEFYQTDDHANTPPVPGSIEALQQLKEHYHFHIITSKPENLREQTIQWLEKHFPHFFKNIYFTNTYAGGGQKVKKSEICKQLSLDFFIEDALDHANDVATVGIPVFLLTTPWNNGVIHESVVRVTTWQEIVQKLM